MGFFGRLFGSKKQDKSAPARDRRRWSFTRSSSPATHSSKRDAPPLSSVSVNAATDDGLDADKHAIAVAAATAAVAEAALAAAHAAAEVVRLTGGTTAGRSGGGGGSNRRWAQEYLAAVKIQSAFRGYLAKRALRALKALVKLQALVRGHIVRKQTTDMLRRMQTLVRLQARARASRASIVSDSFPTSSSPRSIHTRCVSNAELREIIAMDHRSQVGSNRLEHWSEETLWNSNNSSSIRRDRYAQQYNKEEEEDKILEVDTWKPHLASRTFRSDSNHHNESPRKRQPPVIARSAENSPQVSSRPGSSSGSRRKTLFTPTRSEYSWGCYAGNYYSGYYPNYMANTESYRAKVRSQSAPRQRLEFSDNNGYKRSVQGHYDYYAAAERSFDQRSDVGSSGYGVKLSEGLNRNPSGRSKTIHSSLLI